MRMSLANSRTRSTRAMVTTAVGRNQLIHLMKTARHLHMDDEVMCRVGVNDCRASHLTLPVGSLSQLSNIRVALWHRPA